MCVNIYIYMYDRTHTACVSVYSVSPFVCVWLKNWSVLLEFMLWSGIFLILPRFPCIRSALRVYVCVWLNTHSHTHTQYTEKGNVMSVEDLCMLIEFDLRLKFEAEYYWEYFSSFSHLPLCESSSTVWCFLAMWD